MLLFYLHASLFTCFSILLIIVILSIQVRTLRFVDTQQHMFEQLKLETTQRMFRTCASRAPRDSDEARDSADVMRLTHELLDQLLSIITRRGTPFTLLGIKVNAAFVRVIITIISAATASAAFKQILASQSTNYSAR